MQSIPTTTITSEQMWAIPAQELEEYAPSTEPLVSVLMLAYNHSEYIEQAILSIVTQETSGINFELLIGEDCSIDNTLTICQQLQKQYPHCIRLVTSVENVGMHHNFSRLWVRARGKYIAFCEGDDYWIDTAKLAKQVKVLEENPDCNLCGTYTQSIREDEEGVWRNAEVIQPVNNQEIYTFEDLIPRYNFHFSSVIVRKKAINFPRWFWDVYCVDRPLYLLATQQGVARLIPEITSVYRHHTGGGWSPLSWQDKADKSIFLFKAMINYFDPKCKKIFNQTLSSILWFYMSEAKNNKECDIARRLFCKSLKYDYRKSLAEYIGVFKILLTLFFPTYSFK